MKQVSSKSKQADSKEEESPLVVLSHLQRDVSRAFSRHVGMSFSRILVLHELLHEGEMSQAKLQHQLGMEGALLTRFAKEMEKSGLVTRRVDPKDNRLTLMALAPVGRDFLERMEKLGEGFEARLLEGLSENQRAEMVRSMKRIQKNLSGWRD